MSMWSLALGVLDTGWEEVTEPGGWTGNLSWIFGVWRVFLFLARTPQMPVWYSSPPFKLRFQTKVRVRPVAMTDNGVFEVRSTTTYWLCEL